MNNFEFYNPVKVIFGAGEIEKTGEQAAKIGKKALVVSYKEHDFFVDLLNKVYSLLQDNGVKPVAFNEITANPLLSQVEAGVAKAKETDCDFVIAIGGGSAMDAAKCIAGGVLYEGELANMIASSHSGESEVVFPKHSSANAHDPNTPSNRFRNELLWCINQRLHWLQILRLGRMPLPTSVHRRSIPHMYTSSLSNSIWRHRHHFPRYGILHQRPRENSTQLLHPRRSHQSLPRKTSRSP